MGSRSPLIKVASRQDIPLKTDLVVGSPTTPADYEVGDGTLRFCDGWFDVRLDVPADVTATIESMNGADATTLSARQKGGSVVRIGQRADVTIEGLTLRDGLGTSWDGGHRGGGRGRFGEVDRIMLPPVIMCSILLRIPSDSATARRCESLRDAEPRSRLQFPA